MATPALSRPPAVAGMFYPGTAGELARMVDGLLETARAEISGSAPVPKAIIAPHAGYVYSGATAARAHARFAPISDDVERVVLLGPAHRVAFDGLAVPSVAAFEGPLGPVPLDRAAIEGLKTLPGVVELDEAHRQEHSLEVHLPFLRRVLGDGFRLVPIVVGKADAETVAAVLEQLWGEAETVIVVSSDLSHYLDDTSARTRDAATRTAIETLRFERISAGDACGAGPIHGLLRLAQLRDLRATTIELCNSGDTAGPKDRVVGYGAWALTEAAATRLTEEGRAMLLACAARSIRNGLVRGRPSKVRLATFGPELEAERASFITLTVGDRLRGCIGSVQPRAPLVRDVVENAFKSAFEDPRFKKLGSREFGRLTLSISILGAPGRMRFGDQADLLGQLRPGVDGLILESAKRRGVFLPQVWEQCADAAEFLAKLKVKAGLAKDYWAEDVVVHRYTTETFKRPVSELAI